MPLPQPNVLHLIDNETYTLCGVLRVSPKRRWDRPVACIAEDAPVASATCRNCHRLDRWRLDLASRRHLEWCRAQGLDPVTLTSLQKATA